MIIGLAGVKRSGKNESAKIIAEEFGDKYGVNEWSFAEDLKRSAAASLGVNSDTEYAVQFCDSLKENHEIQIWDKSDPNMQLLTWSFSGREFLQWYGTEAHRNIFGSEFWVDNLLGKIPGVETEEYSLDQTSEPQKVWIDGSVGLQLVTDVRFPNEAEAIREAGGIIVRIRRPEVEESDDTHASEIPLPIELVDHEVWNDSDLQRLRSGIIACIRHIIIESPFNSYS